MQKPSNPLRSLRSAANAAPTQVAETANTERLVGTGGAAGAHARSRPPLLTSRGGWILGGVILLLLLTLPLFATGFVMTVLILAEIGCILALSLNLLYGYCGQVNFGVAGFYAIGAYSCVLLQRNLHISYFLALPLAVAAGTLAGAVTGIPLLRLRGHMLALGTMAFSLAIYGYLGSGAEFTGGENGINSPDLFIFGKLMGDSFYYYFTLGGVILAFIFCRNVVGSKVGRAMKAIRDDEKVAEMSGINVFRYRLAAFVMNTTLAAFAGALLSEYTHWIGVDRFDISVNVLVLVMVCFGGLGSNVGALIGGATLMSLPEILSTFQSYRALATGLILILTLRFLPRGIAGALRQLLRLPPGALG